ncbi:hypothetical protein V6N13_098854 [Hibiscus sabdariffa]|uniref:Prokaryotic-type class I peptide chain release factors domain-containing protein n=1 Tax=Hibiscus sabdariffa TaxID=183260 RepID=A0ABR2EFI2_9ROSI
MRQCEMIDFKASNPGSQHRNKRESVVCLKHLPTSIIAQVVEDRSRHMNGASALARLRILIALKVKGSISDAAKFLWSVTLTIVSTSTAFRRPS